MEAEREGEGRTRLIKITRTQLLRKIIVQVIYNGMGQCRVHATTFSEEREEGEIDENLWLRDCFVIDD